MNDNGCRVIRNFWSIAVVGVCLFPHSAVFQTDYGSPGQAVKRTVHTAYQQIHLGLLDLRGPRARDLFGFLFGNLPIALEPGIELYQFVRGELVQACGLEFFRAHHLLNAAGGLFGRPISDPGKSENRAKAEDHAWD